MPGIAFRKKPVDSLLANPVLFADSFRLRTRFEAKRPLKWSPNFSLICSVNSDLQEKISWPYATRIRRGQRFLQRATWPMLTIQIAPM